MSSSAQIFLAFDLYGTLLDTSSVSKRLAEHLPKDADVAGITAEWRKHQLEYSWRISAMGQYENFETLTQKSLVHVTQEAGHHLNSSAIEDIMAAYDRLDAFPDVFSALEKLGSLSGVSCAIFSNGTEKMVSNSVRNVASLSGFGNKTLGQLSHIVVDDVKTFKPFPIVYEYLATKIGQAAGENRQNIWLISGNPFDVVGARNAGLNAIWIDRAGKGWVDQLGKPTTIKLTSAEKHPAGVLIKMSLENEQIYPALRPKKSPELNLITYPAEDPPSPSPPPSMPTQPQILKDRLYVGNLHPSVDEYVLTQLFSKYGKILKMDFLFHKTGPQKGKPRGYSFIEFSTQDAAVNAHAALHDKLLRGRKMVVTFAHHAPQPDLSRSTKRLTDTSRPTTLSLLKGQGKPSATKDRIAALEAKLKQMKEQSPNSSLDVSSTSASVPTNISTPGLPSSLPPRPSSSFPSSTQEPQPLTIFPSSLPPKPLVSTMPTVPSDGAQRKPGIRSGLSIRSSSSSKAPMSGSSTSRDRSVPSLSLPSTTTTATTRTTVPSKLLLPQRHTTNSLGIVIKR